MWGAARERLRELDVPPSDIGAPLPHIFADDYGFAFAYHVHVPDPQWDGTYATVVSWDDEKLCAIVLVRGFHTIRFGAPDAETVHGHRLFSKGLRPHSTYEVENSKWVREMETANAGHDQERIVRQRHVVFTFHDSTLEFIARGFTVTTRTGRVRELLFEAFRNLRN